MPEKGLRDTEQCTIYFYHAEFDSCAPHSNPSGNRDAMNFQNESFFLTLLVILTNDYSNLFKKI